MFAEPSNCRRYHSPRVSLAVSSLEKVWVPDGKCPQKMIENVHRLRTKLADMLPRKVIGNSGPVSAGKIT
ncbi:Uncharacterised protein [Mycobacteroides abscessus subsp. abscessus]|nr:Uncharacterised protein [Mycobacteroides abscessus subsp. abscessus]